MVDPDARVFFGEVGGQVLHAELLGAGVVNHDHGEIHIDGQGSVAPVTDAVVGGDDDIGFKFFNHEAERSDGTGADSDAANGLVGGTDELNALLAKLGDLACHVTGQVNRANDGQFVDAVEITCQNAILEAQERAPGIRDADVPL